MGDVHGDTTSSEARSDETPDPGVGSVRDDVAPGNVRSDETPDTGARDMRGDKTLGAGAGRT